MIIHSTLPSTRVNGPGNRAGIWLQGCTLNCRGCWNKHTHEFEGVDTAPATIATWILGLDGIEGVTFSGGEPMQQAGAVLAIMQQVRKQNPLLTFGMYTGYNESELLAGKFYHMEAVGDDAEFGYTRKDNVLSNTSLWQQIYPMMSFIVAGRFQESRISKADPLRSSTNQIVLFPDGRYSERDLPRQAVECLVSPGGLTTITGFPIGVRGL